MNILVTGATGFIGSHLVPILIGQGHNLAIIKRKKSEIKNIEVVSNKISILDSETYTKINSGIRGFKPDVIIHLATLYINHHDPEDIIDLISSNILLGTHILEAMNENKITKFLNIGTRWQHIGNKRYSPANLYAAIKEAFKDILFFYEKTGIKHKTIELSDTFGPMDKRKKIMDILITSYKTNKAIELTPGEQVLDLLHVDDVCQFIASNIVTDSFFDNRTVSLSGSIIKLRDLGSMIEMKFGKKGLLKWGLRPYRENEVMSPPLYYKKIQVNKHSIEKYIEEEVDKFRLADEKESSKHEEN